MSNFAFGTYRITNKNPQHIQALKEAINSGVKLIDTSSNYMDGEAELAIAEVMKTFDDDIRDNVEIVTKFGYIQGSNMALHKEDPFEDVVEYMSDCYHSISPSFMRDQLTRSLKRLELSSIDCYLIHNPEYYIYDGLNKNKPMDEILDGMYDRIFDVFVALEEEINTGRIRSYGISSNSFSKPSNHPEFLPYEDLVTLAIKAAKYVKNSQHSFTTIELPINLLEKDGLRCASWAKKNNLRVLVNRPLNAQKDGMMFRLADYDESREYYHYLNELLEVSDNDELRTLYNLIIQLDENKHKYGWIGDYESFLYTQIIPHIKKSIEKIDEKALDTLLRYIDMFLVEYKKMVAYECSKSTRIQLKDDLNGCEATLQECAINFLREKDEIDFILIGMRKSSYVQDIVNIFSTY